MARHSERYTSDTRLSSFFRIGSGVVHTGMRGIATNCALRKCYRFVTVAIAGYKLQGIAKFFTAPLLLRDNRFESHR